jgi:iron complex outermembrane recepter protein
VSTGPRRNEITEGVAAAYALGRLKVGPVGLLGGVRLEETDVSATGQVTDPRDPALTLVTRDGKYRELFPSLHLRYEPWPNLLIRASYTNGYARPAFGQLYPVTTVSYNTTTGLGQVTQNRPGLKPQFSDNYDLSLEYYFEPVGVLSASGFRKDLRNFISRETTIIGSGPGNGFDGEYEGFDLVTNRNFGSAKIEGYELNYSQQLRQLPGLLRTLSVFANYTHIKTEGTYDGGNAELVRFIPETANAGLSWRWRKLELRTAWNFKSGYLNTYNANPWARQRVTAVETWDFNAQYRLDPKLNLFIDVVNAFNKWASWYTGSDPGRVIMSEVYGTRVSVGVSGRF